MDTATVKCREHVEEYQVGDLTYDECMEEIEIEWNTFVSEPVRNGIFLCKYCGEERKTAESPCVDFEGDIHDGHEYEEQWEDGPEAIELVSYKTYCWHPLTREQAMEWLSDEMQGRAETAYERVMER